MKRFLLTLFVLTLAGCSSGPSVSQSSGFPNFMWPVKKGKLTQKFKRRPKLHQGIDLGAWKNAPIYASESGIVIYRGRDFTGYGNLIIIEHQGDKWASFYAHLNKFRVKEGARVKKGQLIGLMGKTGRATGVHLHFEIRNNRKAVNPLNLLPQQVFLTHH